MREDINFKMMPLWNTKGVLKNWPIISEGVDKVLLFAKEDTNMIKIFNELMSQHLLLWMGFIDNEYVGFCTTRIENIPFCTKELIVVHLYIKKGISSDVFFNGMGVIKESAKEQGCKKIKFYTTRDQAFEKKMSPLGWKPGYQEFIYEVIENG